MERRKFIGIIGTGSIAIVAGSYISFSSFEILIERIITKDTKSLKVDKEAIATFMADAQKAGVWNVYSFSKKEMIKWYFRLENLSLPLPFFVKYKRYRSEIVGLFLLSTSYFIHKMDSNKLVHYIGLYDPYRVPCANPFSSLFYP